MVLYVQNLDTRRLINYILLDGNGPYEKITENLGSLNINSSNYADNIITLPNLDIKSPTVGGKVHYYPGI